MISWVRCAALVVPLFVFAAPSSGALLSLTVIGGLVGVDGSTFLPEPLSQESLSGSTLTQMGTPLLFDPAVGTPFGITVRLRNTSDLAIVFPDALPGVSVLSAIYGYPGYSARTNVGAGGAWNRTGGAGAEGSVSWTALGLLDSLFVSGSPVVGSNGGGGGAGTGIDETWLTLTGANGAYLASYLAGITLEPGAWIDIPDFVTVTGFHRGEEGARLAVGFDLPTYSFGGVTITTAAWTGSFSGAGPEGEPDPVAVPEPGTLALTVAGLAVLVTGRRRPLGERG